ncbi:arginyltransferase [Vibrio hangzhouensis]|uniref:Aspartate/glutamate leucyltransferase n=1 Tax=Vibrio hangzhouensis TaxID=462991 RepID=A0A1H5YWP4_9VIBR|nr:arginyltransferase [Vibrio hangzhouensis]SEG28461.1 arginine-tRNA-protein transferase [Vibrio hangzhouensis]
MNMAVQQIRIGLSRKQDCSYLPGREERVAIVLEKELHCDSNYEMLLANGFRRSGDAIYKPQCDHCLACDALRVKVAEFHPSKSQKRLRSKARHLRWEISTELHSDWFELYSRYIEHRHSSGSMYPPREREFFDFAQCSWLSMHYLNVFDGDTLIGVAITDVLEDSASAFYTFYDPDYPLSLGTYAVLCQLDFCQQYNKQWLYLGYQIDDCAAMNYKTRFRPHQRLVNQRWQG